MRIILDFTYNQVTPASQRAEWQSWCNEFVGAWFTGHYLDQRLYRITGNLGHVWHPSINDALLPVEAEVPDDTILLYVGRRHLLPAIARCGPGRWLNGKLNNRIGSLSVHTDWKVLEKSSLLHELGHLFGIGTSPTWEAMHPGTEHIPLPGHLFSARTTVSQQFTELDHRALSDLGWKLRPWLFDRDGWVWSSDGLISMQPFGTGYGGLCNPKWRPDSTLTCSRSLSANTVQVNCYRSDGSYFWHDVFTAS